MGHFLKYLFLVLFFFALLVFFHSNWEKTVELKFSIPMIWSYSSPPVILNYLLAITFAVGILFAAFIGAFGLGRIRAQKKEVKRMREELERSTLSASGFSPQTDKPTL